MGLKHIIAIRVRLDTGADRFFLTWGRLVSNDPWPGDIERAVLAESGRWSLGGTAVSATVCDSLRDAAGERYFYECLSRMQHAMPPIGPEFDAWADEVTTAVLRGGELYYLGRPHEEWEPPVDPAARFGYLLECFDKDGDLVAEYELDGLTVEALQEILGDPDVDRVMCLMHAVAGGVLARIVHGRGIDVDEGEFHYYVSPWADSGYRTPRGYHPPPRILPAFPGADERVGPDPEMPPGGIEPPSTG